MEYQESQLRSASQSLFFVAAIWVLVGVATHLASFFLLVQILPSAAPLIEVLPSTWPLLVGTLVAMCLPFALHVRRPEYSLIWSRLTFAFSVLLLSLGISLVALERVTGKGLANLFFWLYWVTFAGGITSLVFAATAIQLESYRSKAAAIVEITVIAAMPVLCVVVVLLARMYR